MSTPLKPVDAERDDRSRASIDLIMGTNNYDTVSKRSVERHYYADEPQFQRYFVSKPLRRSPVINRAYWLRLKAVDVLVRQFLRSARPGKVKIVINLGCGSDVLPWRCHARHSKLCENTTFIDVDHAELMKRKRNIILNTPQLRELLGDDFQISESDADPVLLRSKRYRQIGCDFTDINTLRKELASLFPKESCNVLFVAEMSLIFNDIESVVSLLDFAKNEYQGQICLLEHITPAGQDHPFAKKLLQHYEKNHTPLMSTYAYPALHDQFARFQTRGWNSVRVWDLWDVWSGDGFLKPSERKHVNSVERFDDWEDLMLLARHFVVLHASCDPGLPNHTEVKAASSTNRPARDLGITHHVLLKDPKRRLGGAMRVITPEGRNLLVHIMGMMNSGLSSTYDVLGLQQGNASLRLPNSGPPLRLCFSLTDLGEFGVLLTGGRSTTLDKVFSDCWLLTRGTDPRWVPSWDLPVPLYRHSAVRLGNSSMVLVLGGRTDEDVSDQYFVYHPARGWLECNVQSPPIQPVFGGIACSQPDITAELSAGIFKGVLCGGMNRFGIINTQSFTWQLDIGDARPTICFEQMQIEPSHSEDLAFFGASVAIVDSQVVICGGIGSRAPCLGQSVTSLRQNRGKWEVETTDLPARGGASTWPLMLGNSVAVHGNSLITVGGGAAAFPAGSLWTSGLYAFRLPVDHGRSRDKALAVEYLASPKINTRVAGVEHAEITTDRAQVPMTTIPRVRLSNAEDFQRVLKDRKPVVLEGLDFGACLARWTPQYLSEAVGRDTQVVVHESVGDTPRMDFNSKNFQYVTESFGTVVERMQAGGRLYLRSLSRLKPSETPANLDDDFPSLAQDFSLPKELGSARDKLFSSILRLSGRANMWLHYDVMANIYTQIRGTKKMILFPPRDATRLAFAPGASSSSFDVFSALGTSALAGTHPYEADLGEGDALFLPAAWLHTATPTTDMSVAVNVFFRDLDGGYSEGRDVYGNRDLAAYEKGRQDVARIAKAFRNVPPDMRQFYLSRIADELLQMADSPQ